jgi:hypothetical protein
MGLYVNEDPPRNTGYEEICHWNIDEVIDYFSDIATLVLKTLRT